MIKELQKNIKKTTPEKLFANAVLKAKENQTKYNCFVTIIEQFQKDNGNSLLSGIPYSLKDNFATKGILTTASSNILRNFIPVYNATVYKKLKEAGAVLVGKTVLDELAMGGTGTTAHTGIVRNPHDEKRIVGGSSAGAAASIALGITPFALASDTGDSVRKPAAYTGVVGFKPTYGRISRHGLFPFASSLDHVGCITTCVEDAAIVTDVIKGPDEYDMTALSSDENYLPNLIKSIKGKKLFYIKEMMVASKENQAVLDNFYQVVKICQANGVEVVEISIDKALLQAIYPAYMAISCAEATSNNANLLGINFGVREEGKTIEEIMFNSRTKGFSELIKRRFILGSYILQKENQEKLFLNACRIRRLIVNEINKFFEKHDALIAPATGSIAPEIGKETNKVDDDHLILESNLIIGNFGGYPSITIPSGKVNKLPVGFNITCGVKQDSLTLNIAYQIEQMLKEGENNV